MVLKPGSLNTSISYVTPVLVHLNVSGEYDVTSALFAGATGDGNAGADANGALLDAPIVTKKMTTDKNRNLRVFMFSLS